MPKSCFENEYIKPWMNSAMSESGSEWDSIGDFSRKSVTANTDTLSREETAVQWETESEEGNLGDWASWMMLKSFTATKCITLWREHGGQQRVNKAVLDIFHFRVWLPP